MKGSVDYRSGVHWKEVDTGSVKFFKSVIKIDQSQKTKFTCSIRH